MNTQEKKPSFESLIKESNIPVLVDFYADWCGPCHAMAPVLKDFAGRMKNKIKIIKIDVDKNPGVSAIYGIQGIPTLILFKNGKVIWRKSGLLTRAQLEQELQKFTT